MSEVSYWKQKWAEVIRDNLYLSRVIEKLKEKKRMPKKKKKSKRLKRKKK